MISFGRPRKLQTHALRVRLYGRVWRASAAMLTIVSVLPAGTAAGMLGLGAAAPAERVLCSAQELPLPLVLPRVDIRLGYLAGESRVRHEGPGVAVTRPLCDDLDAIPLGAGAVHRVDSPVGQQPPRRAPLIARPPPV